MAEVLLQFSTPVTASDGAQYIARACGSEMADGRWQGWIEFLPVEPGEPLRTSRETTQPNRADAIYWATGLTPVYLDGALERAQRSDTAASVVVIPPPVFDEPAEPGPHVPPRVESVLDPFSVYRNGEAVLRHQLAALSSWHLVNIIEAHGLSELDPSELDRMSQAGLIELIVAETVRRVESPAR